jgi:hypothetical protein
MRCLQALNATFAADAEARREIAAKMKEREERAARVSSNLNARN